jgi:hypothetical protein
MENAFCATSAVDACGDAGPSLDAGRETSTTASVRGAAAGCGMLAGRTGEAARGLGPDRTRADAMLAATGALPLT